MHSNKAGRTVTVTITYIFCILGLVISLFPIYWMLVSSFKVSTDILKYPPTFWPQNWTLQNYVDAWNKGAFPRFFFNSIFVTAVSVFGQMLFSSLAAYAFAKLKFPGRELIFMLFLSSMMIPAVIILIPQFIIMRVLGMLDSYWALILPFFFGNAFSIFFLRQFFMTVPTSISEASEIDGCSQIRTFFQIFVPLSKHAVITLALLRAVQTWNEFLWPLIVTNSTKYRTVPLAISTIFYTNRAVDWAGLMSASCIALVPLLLLFIFTRDYLMESIAITGFK